MGVFKRLLRLDKRVGRHVWRVQIGWSVPLWATPASYRRGRRTHDARHGRPSLTTQAA